MASKKKEGIGRQKIPIVKMENESHRQVTFSKRRAGLIKKASELSMLCGAEIAIIGFSPSEKPFAFGHLSVESVLDRCLFQNNMSLPLTQQQLHAYYLACCQLNRQLTQGLSSIEDEKEKKKKKKKKKGQAMEETGKESARLSMTKGWEKPIEEMNMIQLQEMKHELEELRKAHMEHLRCV